MAIGRVATNNYSCADFIVDGTGLFQGASHTTLTQALADSASGDSIAMRPGTYTENITVEGGRNIFAMGIKGGANVRIVGTISQSSGTAKFKNIEFLSNSADMLVFTGSTSIQTAFIGCSFFLADGDCLTVNNAMGSPTFENCSFHSTGNDFDYFNIVSCNIVDFFNCRFFNTGTIGTSTIASGVVRFIDCSLHGLFTTTDSGLYSINRSSWEVNDNLTFLTTVGTGITIIKGLILDSGTAAAISIGTGTTVEASQLSITSTNANPLTGAGTLVYSEVEFRGSGNGIDVTTQTPGAIETGLVTVDKLSIPTTSDANTGVIEKNSNRYIHSFGSSNVFMGEDTGNFTLSSNQSVGVGQDALTALTNGDSNTALGYKAGEDLLSGRRNTFVGGAAGQNVTTGSENVAIGQVSLFSVTGGGENVAIGRNAMTNFTGSSCVGIGHLSLQALVSAIAVTAVGHDTLKNSTAGSNTAFGYQAGLDVTTGASNTAIGRSALDDLKTGSFNTALGQISGTSYSDAEESNIVIGNIGTIADANTTRIGTQGTGNGQQDSCFIAGITGVAVAANALPVMIDTATGELGDGTGTFAAFNWAVETDAARALTIMQGVFGNRGTAQTFTLPTTAAVGSMICVTQMGAGVITIDYGTNEFIQFAGSTSTTTTGNIVSTAVGDSVCLVCNLANTSWYAINHEGTWTIT